MSKMYIPEDYVPALNLKETQIALKEVKDFFQRQITAELNLHRVSAPLFVTPESGLNDNLNGVERPVAFGIKEQDDREVEVVHSLAKWKRMALGRYGFSVGEGLYTDMNAIRRDEDTDNIHSIYVDQWDWEKIITKDQRNVQTLQSVVKSVYDALHVTEKYMANKYDYIECILPESDLLYHFAGTGGYVSGQYAKGERVQDLQTAWCGLYLTDRWQTASGEKHDGRAPDYDDWSLNGDILVYYPMTDIALELSSMGIRVE